MQITFELDKNRCTIANNILPNGFILIKDIDFKQTSINEIINKIVIPQIPVETFLKDYIIKIYNDSINLNDYKILINFINDNLNKSITNSESIETLREIYFEHYLKLKN